MGRTTSANAFRRQDGGELGDADMIAEANALLARLAQCRESGVLQFAGCGAGGIAGWSGSRVAAVRRHLAPPTGYALRQHADFTPRALAVGVTSLKALPITAAQETHRAFAFVVAAGSACA